jgi:YfiH family protein
MNGFQQGFTLWKREGVRFLTVPSFERAGGVRCAFSTRVGGVSPAPYDTLNFSRKREQNEENFIENMRRFACATGFNYMDAVVIRYAHSPLLYRAESKDAGCGVVREGLPETCDGLYTDTPGLPILSMHADCVPLFFYDPVGRAASVCHAGWKGTSQHMARNALQALLSLGCSAKDILAAIGPCISVKYYEVGEEVAEIFVREFGDTVIQRRDGSCYADLAAACALDMLETGVPMQNITLSGLCTYGLPKLFYSHRRDQGRTGAMTAMMELI